MRPTTMLLHGLLALCLLPCLPGCATSGAKPPPVIHNTQVIDAPRAQYVGIDPGLTSKPALPPLPAPAVVDSDKCAAGCYSNKQLRDLLDAALDTLGRCWDRLDAIRTLSDKAVQSNTPPKP